MGLFVRQQMSSVHVGAGMLMAPIYTPSFSSSRVLYTSLFLKLTVHSTYTEMLQINEQIKLYTIYTNTVNRQMELAGRTDYHIYISNKFT